MDVTDTLQQRLESGQLGFALDSPKAVIKQSGSTDRKPRPTDPPVNRIREMRAIRRTDPHVAEMVNTLVDYLVGSGFNVAPANVPYTDDGQEPAEIADFKKLVEAGLTDDVMYEWVDVAVTDGTGFLELVVEEDVFKPKVLPTTLLSIRTDEFGVITGYQMDNPAGGDPIEFERYDIAVLRFHRYPGEEFGRSLIEPIAEHANMLRDMEIDLARFVATKAYPPILWQLGTEERPWTPTQMDEWLNSLSDIEPTSMIAAGHDVAHEIVGVTSTSSKAGALNLDSTFAHLLLRMHTGMGIPKFFYDDSGAGRNSSVAVMPKFDRRIQRYRRIIRAVVRYQVFVSILAGDSEPEEYSELPPDFEFGQHSSEEERLETAEAIQLFMSGFLTREAAAERMGIDPEAELPDEGELSEIIDLIAQLAGQGDSVLNPEGGRPTKTGTGVESPGREVKSRDNPERTDGDSRPKRDVSNE
jgi:hypothetical protein